MSAEICYVSLLLFYCLCNEVFAVCTYFVFCFTYYCVCVCPFDCDSVMQRLQCCLKYMKHCNSDIPSTVELFSNCVHVQPNKFNINGQPVTLSMTFMVWKATWRYLIGSINHGLCRDSSVTLLNAHDTLASYSAH